MWRIFYDFLGFRYERRREIEEENLFLRKIQIKQELGKQVPIGEIREIDKETNIHDRTKKFYELREKLYEYVNKFWFSMKTMEKIGKRYQKIAFWEKRSIVSRTQWKSQQRHHSRKIKSKIIQAWKRWRGIIGCTSVRKGENCARRIVGNENEGNEFE